MSGKLQVNKHSERRKESKKMNMKRLSVVLIVVGSVVLFVAVVWWNSFYAEVARQIRPHKMDATKCLFSSSGECAAVSLIAQFAGVTPYNPTSFWIGVILIGTGIVIRVAVKENANAGDRIKGIAGKKPIHKAYVTGTEWFCACGQSNVLDRSKAIQVCANCGMNRDFALENFG